MIKDYYMYIFGWIIMLLCWGIVYLWKLRFGKEERYIVESGEVWKMNMSGAQVCELLKTYAVVRLGVAIDPVHLPLHESFIQAIERYERIGFTNFDCIFDRSLAGRSYERNSDFLPIAMWPDGTTMLIRRMSDDPCVYQVEPEDSNFLNPTCFARSFEEYIARSWDTWQEVYTYFRDDIVRRYGVSHPSKDMFVLAVDSQPVHESFIDLAKEYESVFFEPGTPIFSRVLMEHPYVLNPQYLQIGDWNADTDVLIHRDPADPKVYACSRSTAAITVLARNLAEYWANAWHDHPNRKEVAKLQKKIGYCARLVDSRKEHERI